MEKQRYGARFLESYPDVLNVKQLTELLQISVKTTYEIIKSGKIQCLRVGREYRFPKPFILEFLEVDQGSKK